MEVYTTSHGVFMINVSEGIAYTLQATDYKDAPIVAYPILRGGAMM